MGRVSVRAQVEAVGNMLVLLKFRVQPSKPVGGIRLAPVKKDKQSPKYRKGAVSSSSALTPPNDIKCGIKLPKRVRIILVTF